MSYPAYFAMVRVTCNIHTILATHLFVSESLVSFRFHFLRGQGKKNEQEQ